MGIPVRQVCLGGEGSSASSEQAFLNACHPLLFRPLYHRLAWGKHHQDPHNLDHQLHHWQSMSWVAMGANSYLAVQLFGALRERKV